MPDHNRPHGEKNPAAATVENEILQVRWGYAACTMLSLATFAVAVFGPPSCVSQSPKQPIKIIEPKEQKPHPNRSSGGSGLAANSASGAFLALNSRARG